MKLSLNLKYVKTGENIYINTFFSNVITRMFVPKKK